MPSTLGQCTRIGSMLPNRLLKTNRQESCTEVEDCLSLTVSEIMLSRPVQNDGPEHYCRYKITYIWCQVQNYKLPIIVQFNMMFIGSTVFTYIMENYECFEYFFTSLRLIEL